jgi:hypothetical protein
MTVETNVRTRLRSRLGVVLAVALGVLLIAPAGVSAASVTFGDPSGASTFGTAIVFTQPYSGSGIASASIALTLPGDIGPQIVPIPRPGSASLSYTLDTSGGAVSPFESVTAQFRAVLSDGSEVAGPSFIVVYADDRFTWKSVSGSLVTIHWFQGSNTFAQQLLSYGEKGIAKSAAFMGITETKPVDFYIYPSQTAFQAGLSVPETIGGEAFTNFRTAFALVGTSELSYGSTVVPHELTHQVFADLTDNPYHSPPRWLNEGLATYLSEGYGSSDRSLVSKAAKNGTLVPLAALAGYFALDQTRIYLSYAEATSAVDYMVRTYGQTAVRKMLTAYSTGASDDEAFTRGLGVDVATFDKAWLAGNGVAAAKTYGPVAAPTGALPPGWDGSTATAPPVSPTTPGSTPSGSPASGGSTKSSSDTTVLLIAGVIALAGLVLLGAGAILYARSGRPPVG